jgi:hypothetical protein
MAIEFNKFQNAYNNYNIAVGAGASKQVQKEEEKQVDTVKANNEFVGLENETDLLTKNTQYLYGAHFGQFSTEDKDIADNTNAIMASLGYGNYKVSAAQVASITAGVNEVVLPGMNSAERGAIEANIKDPNGPFADLFA